MDSATQPSTTTSEGGAARAPVGLGAIFQVFLMAGAVSFGGGVVAYLREYLVSARGWLDDEQFLTALEIGETLPGVNALNIAVIVGDNLRGVAGAAVAATALMLPGSVVVMMLAVLWESQRQNPLVTAFLLGIAASAVGLLSAVSLRLGRHQFTRMPDVAIVVATFILVSVLHVSLVLVLLIIGPLGIWLYRPGQNRGREMSMPHPFHRWQRHVHYRR
ncbi:MAG: chromate transporter [Candidatus Binataceae bacterium]